MGFYGRRILPRLLDLAMSQRQLAAYRHRAVPAARGTVLEIGIGSGLNLPHYSRELDRVYGIDLSPELLNVAAARTKSAACPVLLVRAAAEALPIRAASIDAVVMTWTLCSVLDPLAALGEMRRVLKPRGRLLFVEHGLSPEPRVKRWQNWLTPCWKRIGGGCHLNRKMDDLIRAAGFEIEELHTGYMTGPRHMTFLYEGTARTEPSGEVCPPPAMMILSCDARVGLLADSGIIQFSEAPTEFRGEFDHPSSIDNPPYSKANMSDNRWILRAALVSLLAVGGASAAAAHAVLDHAVPAVGSTVRVTPPEVRIWFSEAIELAFSRITVTDAAGQTVSQGKTHLDLHSAKELEIALRKLLPGAYTVSWRVVSVDTHSTHGRFTFTVAP